MLSTCPPHGENCGMVHISSSPHATQYDPHSAIREIRRSLSRSPSKSADFRHFTYRSSPAKGSTPFHPSPLSPSRRSTSDNLLHLSSFSASHQSRINTNSRINRPTLRRSVQGYSVMRARTSPKSPTKRALLDTTHNICSTPMLRKRSSAEAEVDVDMDDRCSENKENMLSLPEDNMMWKSAPARQEKRRSGPFLDVMPISPMKRGEGSADTSPTDCESPSAKRRSLHGSSTFDFNIFDAEALQQSEQRRSQDDSDWLKPSSPLSSSRFSTIPKRSSSLRKSTLQQRQPERFNQFKLNQLVDANIWTDGSSPVAEKKSFRISLDSHLPPMPRDSPFSAQGTLLNASIHPIAFAPSTCHSQPPRHPLSRTMTQSSSSQSIADDSPTHEPIRRPDRPKSLDFSKSLPVGALRPTEDISQEIGSEFSSQASFATPANYKSARPLPAAFMSTGLISKKNRNVDEVEGGLPKAHMPDTPCKRQSVIFDSAKKFRPVHDFGKLNQSTGTPPTPAAGGFGFSRTTPLPWTKHASLFKTATFRPSFNRRTSFASIDPEERASSQSLAAQADGQSTDNDFPPTPTKNINDATHFEQSTSPSHQTRRHSLSHSNHGSSQVSQASSCKLSPIQASPISTDGESDSAVEDSPSTRLQPKSLLRILSKPSLSFTQSRALRNLNSPTPLSRQTFVDSSLMSPAIARAKLSSLSPVSPHPDGNDQHQLPLTPQEHVFPDPSSLSISGRSERSLARPGSSHLSFVPATPTGPREYFGNFSNRPSLNLNAPEIADVDRTLATKFDHADLVGTGEFSQVYRVTRSTEASPFPKIFSRSISKVSSTDKVWAVKKSRYPYSGPKDRQRKVQEVDTLKALGMSEHVVNYVDSWEDRGHLYIQTEFCEEGTLDVFLAQVGLKARLDDFRIWKILLELSLGLQHIHQSGFIHLDLKPANVLITFDGTLKIGDFGMASKWPAKAGIEGEGDREYIGPEILRGQYDKPADIFALGLIMLETAGNVELPDNGLSWQKLRQGDMSDVPSLTWSSEDSNISRDVDGTPLPVDQPEDLVSNTDMPKCIRSGELLQPPSFMINPNHEEALDSIVRWMISPEPNDRPIVQQLLETQGVRFAESRRRAGATIFEGNWGPADEVIAEDAEMIDV